jgi:hypothetical protein
MAAPVSHVNAPINTTSGPASKFKGQKTVRAECPWSNSAEAEACCCRSRGSGKSRPVKDCHNLRTHGQFCDSCKMLNADRARTKKLRQCEKVARELLAKGAESSSMGLPSTSEASRTSTAHVVAPVLKEPEFLSVPPMLLDQGYCAAFLKAQSARGGAWPVAAKFRA